MSKGLDLRTFAEAKGFTVGELSQFGLRAGQGGIVIPYYDQAGNEYIKYRIRDSVDDGEGFRWSAGDAELIPYGLHRPVPYTQQFVWIVEGESDCWALWLNGIPALGLPGAASVKPLDVKYFTDVKTIAVVQEPGEAGQRFPHRVAQKLYDTGFAGTVYAVPLPDKDPRSLLIADRANFRKRLSQAYLKSRVEMERPKKADVLAPLPDLGLVDVDDLLNAPEVPIQWRIEGLLPTASVMLLAGKSGVGKSVLARNLAASVASGQRFLNHHCKPGLVIWASVAEESPATWLRHMRKLKVAGMPIKYLKAVPDPANRLAWLREVLERFEPALVIIDTIVRFLDIEESTNFGLVSRVTAPLLELRDRFSTSFVWLHHTNNAGGVHGQQTWERVPDIVAIYTSAEDERRYLRTTKGRDDIKLPATIVNYDPDTGRISTPGTRFEDDVARAEQAILDSGRSGSREALAKCGVEQKAGRVAIDNLIARGLYVASTSGRVTTFHPADGSFALKESEPISSNVYIYKTESTELNRTQPNPADSTESTELTELTESDADLLMQYADEVLG